MSCKYRFRSNEVAHIKRYTDKVMCKGRYNSCSAVQPLSHLALKERPGKVCLGQPSYSRTSAQQKCSAPTSQ